GDCGHLCRAEKLVLSIQLRVRVDLVLDDLARRDDAQRGAQRRGPPEADVERRGLAGNAEITVELLQDAIEEQCEKAAVHDSRWPFVEVREVDLAFTSTVCTRQSILREARVVVADVA